MIDTYEKASAQMLAALCVRNTFLEDLHSGTVPTSKTGDYSDITVKTPYGEIPWNEVSRLNDDEMKILMKEVVSKLYTFFQNQNDDDFMDGFVNTAMRYIEHWDEPKIDSRLLSFKN